MEITVNKVSTVSPPPQLQERASQGAGGKARSRGRSALPGAGAGRKTTGPAARCASAQHGPATRRIPRYDKITVAGRTPGMRRHGAGPGRRRRPPRTSCGTRRGASWLQGRRAAGSMCYAAGQRRGQSTVARRHSGRHNLWMWPTTRPAAHQRRAGNSVPRPAVFRQVRHRHAAHSESCLASAPRGASLWSSTSKLTGPVGRMTSSSPVSPSPGPTSSSCVTLSSAARSSKRTNLSMALGPAGATVGAPLRAAAACHPARRVLPPAPATHAAAAAGCWVESPTPPSCREHCAVADDPPSEPTAGAPCLQLNPRVMRTSARAQHPAVKARPHLLLLPLLAAQCSPTCSREGKAIGRPPGPGNSTAGRSSSLSA